jgi:cupin 2 domain-containing protein
VNLLSPLPDTETAERIDVLLITPGLRIERIVSQGQASPPGFWYDQAEAEWVTVLTGSARLRFADETGARVLAPGDWVDIAPHRRHRVEWTDPTVPTVWLAVFYACEGRGQQTGETGKPGRSKALSQEASLAKLA